MVGLVLNTVGGLRDVDLVKASQGFGGKGEKENRKINNDMLQSNLPKIKTTVPLFVGDVKEDDFVETEFFYFVKF